MSPIEIIAFVLGVINVTLVVRRSVWNYPVGVIMVVLYGVIFTEAKLYSDALLQVFFVVVNVYGWVHWSGIEARAGEIAVERMTWRGRMEWTLGAMVAAIAWGAVMRHGTDTSYPWWDAINVAGSIVAQILMTRRKLENWVAWIAVDISSIGLYAIKGLWLTAILYVIFLVLATWGLIDWRLAERRAGAHTDDDGACPAAAW